MPKGIVIIDWDEFEGGIISWRFPLELDVPNNLVQLLQISHTFSEGLLTIKEETFHAVSIGNEMLQKVIVLILSEYEDENDFFDIVHTLNNVVSDSMEEQDQLENQLLRIFQLSQSVFKARDAVLTKLAEDVTDLKNREIDIKQSLEWLCKHEDRPKFQVIYVLLRFGPLGFDDLQAKVTEHFKMGSEDFHSILEEMAQAEILRRELDEKYHLLIHFPID